VSTWTVAPLSEESWAPAVHLRTPSAQVAPVGYTGPLVKLGELVEFVSPARDARSGEPIVTPAGVSPQTGAVQPTERSAVGAVFRLGRELREGDVLVPLVGKGPCVLVVPQHAGLAFSQGFAALRLQQRGHATTLWGQLSSRTGLEARHQLDRGAVTPRINLAVLAELLVPAPDATAKSVDDLLPAPAVDELAASLVVSQWAALPLSSEVSWETARLLDPLADAGVPVTALGRVRAGRLDARLYRDSPFPGCTPALRPSDVGRLSTPRWWTVAQERDIVMPGAIVVGALSARATSPPQPVAVAKDILVLDVHDWRGIEAMQVCDRLVAYLGSPAGQRRLTNLKRGSYIPRISKKDFLELRVPAPENLPNARVSASELLDARLEQALWS